MSGGLNPKKHILIVLALGLFGSILLFSLPKVLIDSEAQEQSATTSPENGETTSHTELTDLQKNTLSAIRETTSEKTEQQKALSDYFAEQNLFDSAAYFAKLIATNTNKEEDWIKTGDLLYQAYSLSLNPINREKLAEDARVAYQKVLNINPMQLHARTNTAMTYVSSASPMQAILMLRQVLEDQPNYTPAMMSMGALSMQSGQYDRAVSRFEDVLALEPQNLNASLGLAYSLIEVGDVERAKTILNVISNAGVDEVLQNEINNTLKSLN